jgi:hypothetical protein
MTRIAIDTTVSDELDAATGPVELVDKNTGRVLGRFVPQSTMPLLPPELGCSDSDEVVREALAEAMAYPGIGKPLSQIWKELGRTE